MASEKYYVVQEKMGNEWKSIIYPPTSFSSASVTYDRYEDLYPNNQFRIIEIVTIKKELE